MYNGLDCSPRNEGILSNKGIISFPLGLIIFGNQIRSSSDDRE